MLVQVRGHNALRLHVDEVPPPVRLHPQAHVSVLFRVPEAPAKERRRPILIPPRRVARPLYVGSIGREPGRNSAMEACVGRLGRGGRDKVQRHCREAPRIPIRHYLAISNRLLGSEVDELVSSRGPKDAFLLDRWGGGGGTPIF